MLEKQFNIPCYMKHACTTDSPHVCLVSHVILTKIACNICIVAIWSRGFKDEENAQFTRLSVPCFY